MIINKKPKSVDFRNFLSMRTQISDGGHNKIFSKPRCAGAHCHKVRDRASKVKESKVDLLLN
jgi:hypothetical protein